MRIALVILAMMGISLGLVKFRKDEVLARHDMEQLQNRVIEQRRILAEQFVRLSRLTPPAAVKARAEDLGLSLAPPTVPPAEPRMATLGHSP